MRDSRDKIIDQLIDDKNRIYTRLKREERENAVLKSQLKYVKQRLEYAEKKIKELSNEIINSRHLCNLTNIISFFPIMSVITM